MYLNDVQGNKQPFPFRWRDGNFFPKKPPVQLLFVPSLLLSILCDLSALLRAAPERREKERFRDQFQDSAQKDRSRHLAGETEL